MLIGEYKVAFGEKNRIALPKKLRVELQSELIITRGYDGCGIILDQNMWAKLIESIGQKSLFRMNARDTRRYLIGGASEVELDKQGRFVVPEYILEHIGNTGNDVVLIGLGDWIELWDLEAWSQKISELRKDASDIADRLVNTSN